MKPKIVDEILAADKAPPEAAFDNASDMLAYLNDTPSSVSIPAQDATALADEPSRDELLALAGEQEGEAKAHLAMGDKFEARNSIIRAQSLRLRATSQTPDALRSTLKDIIAVYEWCSVDPIDRGYSSLDSEIHRAKHLLSTPSASAGPQADAVAWQWRCKVADDWTGWHNIEGSVENFKRRYAENLESGTTEFRPVYAHPQPQQAPELIALLTAIIDTNNEFRDGMPKAWRDGHEWEGDPLQDAIDAAIRALRSQRTDPPNE